MMSRGRVLSLLLSLFLVIPATKGAGLEPLSVPFDQVHEAVLKDGIGIVGIFCWHEGMRGGSGVDKAWQEAETRERYLDQYMEGTTGFRKIAPLAVRDLVPLSEWRYDGVIRRFPATRTRGDFIQMVYDVAKNLRTWVRLTPNRAHGCEVSYVSLVTDGPMSMEPDLRSLNRGQRVRLYRSPSRSAKWVSYDYSDDGFEVMTEQRNGFGLVVLEDCEGKRLKTLGWVPFRDERGRLILWIWDIPNCC